MNFRISYKTRPTCFPVKILTVQVHPVQRKCFSNSTSNQPMHIIYTRKVARLSIRLSTDHSFVILADICTSFPCLNNGTCAVNETTGHPNCTYPPGYSGPHCESKKKIKDFLSPKAKEIYSFAIVKPMHEFFCSI